MGHDPSGSTKVTLRDSKSRSRSSTALDLAFRPFVFKWVCKGTKAPLRSSPAHWATEKVPLSEGNGKQKETGHASGLFELVESQRRLLPPRRSYFRRV